MMLLSNEKKKRKITLTKSIKNKIRDRVHHSLKNITKPIHFQAEFLTILKKFLKINNNQQSMKGNFQVKI